MEADPRLENLRKRQAEFAEKLRLIEQSKSNGHAPTKQAEPIPSVPRSVRLATEQATSPPASENTADTQGIGLQYIDQRTSANDMRLVRRAIKNGWNVPEKTKQVVVEEMQVILERSEDERNKIAAARTLIAADAIDQKTEGDADMSDATAQASTVPAAERMQFFAELGRILADDPIKKAAVSDMLRKRIEANRGKFVVDGQS